MKLFALSLQDYEVEWFKGFPDNSFNAQPPLKVPSLKNGDNIEITDICWLPSAKRNENETIEELNKQEVEPNSYKVTCRH